MPDVPEEQRHVRLLRLETSPVVPVVWQVVWVRTCVLPVVSVERRTVVEPETVPLPPELELEEVPVQCPPEHRVVPTLERLV